jgi:hypothetical protein
MPESQNVNLVTVPFYGDNLVTCQWNGEPHVAMRRLVENLQMSWGHHSALLRDEADKFNCSEIRTVGADGKERSMLAIPLRKLPLWLACINPKKVRDHGKRARIEFYQEGCAVALHDYWTKGVAVRGDMDGVVIDLDPAVRQQIGGIMKGVIGAALRELVPAMVREEIASQQFGVVPGVTAGKVLDMAGVTNRKGLKGLDRFVSNRLWRFHAEKGVAVRRAELGLRTAYMFDQATAKEWLDRGGKASIQQRVAEKRGQGVLRLVSAAEDRPRP